MEWKEKLKALLEPYGEITETEKGLIFEFGDDEGDFSDRLAFIIEKPEEWPLVEVAVKAIADLTDHDVPGRNLFAFGFTPDFKGTVLRLGLFDGKPGAGPVIGDVPEKAVKIAERNDIEYQRGSGDGIGLPGNFTEKDFEALIKLVEAIAFEW
ncbi:hypothetical protein TEU_09425 [Thermococcus eurythermalis]|uniref:Uncharacterized protein n=1 Tax=Thermococcus eurythermalis TaxID=1505907 RepID=A0A097QVN0_9EURY|nr:hypothetical protein [Thermococcus eurythermalis]AIU70531.1 hypothetical protein TEU_09425 [Thermococcus eurythermalis]